MKKTILITGASSGLGEQIAKIYKESDWHVINISRRTCVYADTNILLSLREGKDIEHAAAAVIKLNKPLSIIVNAVGVWSDEKFGSISEDEIKRLMSTNVKAPMLLISKLWDHILENHTDILNIASTAGTEGKADIPVYAASKWAERGFTKSLQNALKNTASRVIDFCPGGMNTELFAKVGSNMNTGSWMDPKDMASFIKNILDLPKNIEVSEIILNRK